MPGVLELPVLQALREGWGHVQRVPALTLPEAPPDDGPALDSWMVAASQRRMEELLRSRKVLGQDMLGLTVLTSGRPCVTCGTQPTNYTWADYDAGKVPSLPRHSGCACAYSPWL